MRRRGNPRIIIPLAACGLSIAAAVVGGACNFGAPATSPQPLSTGNYVLTVPGSQPLPAIITDSAGRRLRVIADTFAFVTSDHTYQEGATVAITLPGGAEQPPAPFSISRRAYALTGDAFTLPSTLYGGSVHGTVTSNAIVLSMPDRTPWRYDHR